MHRARASVGALTAVAMLLGAPARADTVFSGSSAAAALDCGGGDALVRGSGNRLTIGGACRTLAIQGSDNVVAVNLAAGGKVSINGDDNRVLYTYPAGPPRSEASGASNEVLPDARPPTLAVVMAPLPLLLVDASSAYDLACGGRDVLVRGDGLRAVLRGGCRSLTVQGQSDMITAELLPGAAVAIGGPAVILNYILVAEGPAPRVRVTSPGLEAKQIQHYGETQLSLPTGR